MCELKDNLIDEIIIWDVIKQVKAFTIAEVLIPLGIIGFIVAITIPELVDSYQKSQYSTALKKAYNMLNQALMKITTDNQCINDLRCTGAFSVGTNSQTLGDALVKYFNTSKICGTTPDKGCWTDKTNKNYDGTATPDHKLDSSTYYKFTTLDGMSFAFYNYAEAGSGSADCSSNWSTGKLGNMSQVCGQIIVDVNGQKEPNNWGLDTFAFWITNGKGAMTYPYGGVDDGGEGWWKNPAKLTPRFCCPENKYGLFCAGRVMEENWQITY